MRAEFGQIQLVANEEPRLAREFQDLPTTVWAAPSRCPGWNNARVLSHLAFYAEIYRDSAARALQGDSAAPPGPDGRPPTREEFLARAASDERTMAQQPPRDLLREFSRSGDELMAMFQSLMSADFDRPAWHYTQTITVGTLVVYRLYELAIHGWDIRAALDPAAQILPKLCPPVVDTVRLLLPWLCTPERSIAATCRFEVDGQIWTTQIGDGKLEEVTEAGEPDAVIRTDVSTFLLLATMRQELTDCENRVAIEGARERAEQMLLASRFRV